MRRWSSWLFAGVLFGCGADKSPVDKCDDLINVVCDRAVQCLGPSGGTQAQCVQQVQASLPCGSAKSVSASYDRCIDQLDSDDCSVLFPTDPQTGQQTLKLPADCMSVILTRSATAPVVDRPWSPLDTASQAEAPDR